MPVRRGKIGRGRLLLTAALLSIASGASAQGFTLAAELQGAAFKTRGTPSVVVHAPADFNPRAPLHLVVFLHGYNGCVAVLMGRGPTACKPGTELRDGWDLGAHHDAANTNTLFVVPQLAYLQRDGRPGAFGKRGGFRAFLEELLGQTLAAPLGRAHRIKDIASLTLVAHSAGYQTAIAIAERGGVRAQLKGIVLLDALYAETDRYAHFLETHASRGLRFVSLYLERGEPRRQNQRLYRRLERSLGDSVEQAHGPALERAVAAHSIVIGQGRPPHRLMPETHLAELLRALGRVYLPPRIAANSR